MKSVIFFGLIYLVVLPLLAVGCDRASSANTDSTPGYAIDLALTDFTSSNDIVKDIVVSNPGSFSVRLESNASTGYAWGAPVIDDATILGQGATQTETPKETTLVGAAGAQIFDFKTLKKGTTAITFSYSQPWEGGQKDIYTLTINVTVK